VAKVTAYVVVDTENPGPKRVVREIRRLPGVVRADALFGTPDIVAPVEGDDIAGMARGHPPHRRAARRPRHREQGRPLDRLAAPRTAEAAAAQARNDGSQPSRYRVGRWAGKRAQAVPASAVSASTPAPCRTATATATASTV
jgi:hypothetical protein